MNTSSIATSGQKTRTPAGEIEYRATSQSSGELLLDGEPIPGMRIEFRRQPKQHEIANFVRNVAEALLSRADKQLGEDAQLPSDVNQVEDLFSGKGEDVDSPAV